MINKKISEKINSLRSDYQNNKPFSHLIVDDFLNEDEYLKAYSDFNLDRKETIDYVHASQCKRGLTDFNSMGPNIQELIRELSSKKFLEVLEKITGLKNLKFDDSLHGGGLHEVKEGGYLNIHKDFGTHPTNKTWKRRINLLFYFNNEWKEEWNGFLELWENDKSKCAVKIDPKRNRMVMFDVIGSYHGHPDPLTCPSNVSRKSLALYYFTDEKIEQKTISTYYTHRPSDNNLYKIKIFFDRQLVKIYSLCKRYLKIEDKTVEKFLKIFFKK